jgi:hypothetical protein
VCVCGYDFPSSLIWRGGEGKRARHGGWEAEQGGWEAEHGGGRERE